MHCVHFPRAKFKFSGVLILVQWLITVSAGAAEDITCTVTTYLGKDTKTDCQIDRENSDCPQQKLQIDKEIGHPDVVLNNCNANYCNVEISSPFYGRGLPVFFINGYDLQGEQICFKVAFSSLKSVEDEEMVLNAANIPLPHGQYLLTGYAADFGGKPHTFVRKSLKIWNHREAGSWKCRVVQCRFYKYEFLRDSGLLRLFFKFEDGTCDQEADNKVTLMKLMNESEPMTEEKCRKYNNTDDHDIISRAFRYRKAMDISTQPMDFPNVETGCYVVRARPGCYFGFFWLNSTNIVDLNKWNTSILLVPREIQGSLQIHWEWPSFPYNFTGWRLKLWKMEDYPVQCNGQNPMDKELTTMSPAHVLTTNHYTFSNLTAGYYCVRLGGIDDRCPDDGCELRSSATVLFDPSRSELTENEPVPYGVPIILLVITGVIVGVCFTLICFRYSWTSKNSTLHYELVADRAKNLGKPSVLLIWTKYSPTNSPSPEPLINVLKHLLRNYYLCQVFDYLDPLSLPKDQCRQLMSDPTSWLNSHLRKSDVKIIIIASEGAYWRQQELIPGKDQDLATNLPNPLDKNLFPYVLNFLQESFKLAADYSRVFQVCFPDVYGNGMELDGLVDSARYNMPEHIKELAYRIHGSNDCITYLMKGSENGQIEFNEAISLMKNSQQNEEK